jgi:septal ring factor EnvC (AmiA/AmiB activator)
MKITFSTSLAVAAVLGGVLLCPPSLRAAEANGAKDSQTLVVEMRLKRWNKELELSAEQQSKIKAMLTEESKQIAKLDEDKALTVSARATKIDEMHVATYEKIKPLLTETQVPVFEKLTTKTKKPKKAAAPANPNP